MEEDNLSNNSAIAGYNAFCSTFEVKMNELIRTLDLIKLKLGITEEMEDGIEAAIREAVESAISDSMNIFEAAWNWIAGPDQTLGSASFRFGHDDLLEREQFLFKERWKNGVSVTTPLDTTVKEFIIRGPGRVVESGGEWEVFGTTTATPVEQFIGEFGPPVTFSQGELAIQSFRHRAEVASREGYTGGFPTFKNTRDKHGNEFSTTIFLNREGAIWRNIEWILLGMPQLDDFVERIKASNSYARKNGFAGGFPTFYEKPSILKSITEFDGDLAARSFSSAGTAGVGMKTNAADIVNYIIPNSIEPQRLFGEILSDRSVMVGMDKLAPAVSSIVCATVLIKTELAELRYIKLSDLGNPRINDINARFNATHNYAISNGFVGGFPTFFDQNFSLEISDFDVRCGTMLLKQEIAVAKDVLVWKSL